MSEARSVAAYYQITLADKNACGACVACRWKLSLRGLTWGGVYLLTLITYLYITWYTFVCVRVPFFQQRNTGRTVSSNPVQPDASHLVQADSAVRD